jgi:hypothetical protein
MLTPKVQILSDIRSNTRKLGTRVHQGGDLAQFKSNMTHNNALGSTAATFWNALFFHNSFISTLSPLVDYQYMYGSATNSLIDMT